MSQNNDFECCICLDSDKTLVMLKCHHLHIVCLKCYREIDKCPICRSLIERDQQLIDSCQIEIEDMKKLINKITSNYFYHEWEYHRICKEYQLALDEISKLKNKQ